jgi:hypothetical protein
VPALRNAATVLARLRQHVPLDHDDLVEVLSDGAGRAQPGDAGP